MEKRGIKLNSLVFLILIVLAIGIGIGYLITININNVQTEKQASSVALEEQLQTENTQKNVVINNTIDNNSQVTETQSSASNNTSSPVNDSTTMPQINYDDNKEIMINGQNYTISVVKKYSQESMLDDVKVTDDTDLEIYFNNHYIKTLGLGNKVGDYKTKLYNFGNNYIVLEVTYSNAYFDNGNLIIIDTQGNIVSDNLKRSTIKGWHIKSTNETGWYEVNDDNIIIYEEARYALEKVKYTINNNKLIREVIAHYDWNDVQESGK